MNSGNDEIVENNHENAPSNSHAPENAVEELAKLNPLSYERVRAAKAKELKVRVGVLDDMVKNEKKSLAANDDRIKDKVEPWDEVVGGEGMLNEISDLIRRYVICDASVVDAATLWIIFTWLIDTVDVAPMALITSPDKRCGKTQMLNLFEHLCRHPLSASSITTSALYRCIEKWKPTLLIDEADTFLKSNDQLRGVLNSGHTREKAFVIVNVRTGDDFEPQQFNTWGAKAIASIGVGGISDTLIDRSIALKLRRKLNSETVERLRHQNTDDFKLIKRKIMRWVNDNHDQIKSSRPEPLQSLNDRAQDNWEPLFAIAAVVGGDWLMRAQLAAEASSKSMEKEVESTSIDLLIDIKNIFENNGIEKYIWTKDLIKMLSENDDMPWGSWNKSGAMKPHQLAKMLREFDIKSINIRGGGVQTAKVQKGYEYESFKDAFARYVPPTSNNNATTLQHEDVGIASEESCSDVACSGS